MRNIAFAQARGRIHYPELDSIRGLGFLVVFTYHASGLSELLKEGSLGLYVFKKSGPFAIETFFVLSSFLLTWLALNEEKRKGKFSIRNYFMRRVLRIWPLYFLIMAIGFIAIPLLASHSGQTLTLPNKWYYLLFIANFYTLPHVYFLQFLWSISVEEQFYFIWGFSLKFLMKHIKWIAFVIMAISVGFTVHRISHQTPKYFHTLNYFFDFACGALAAYALFIGNRIVRIFSNFNRFHTTLYYLALPILFVLFYFLEKNNPGIAGDFYSLLFRYLFIIYVALLIIEQLTNPSRTKVFGKNKFLILTGKISYGLYCFHGINITLAGLIVSRFFPDLPIIITYMGTFIFNYVLAWTIYTYYELPFLRLKEKWKGA